MDGSNGATASRAADLGHEAHAKDLVEQEAFVSICTPGKLVLLAFWREAKAAERWRPSAANAIQSLRHRQVRVIRDYGMFECREEPQYYEEVPGRT